MILRTETVRILFTIASPVSVVSWKIYLHFSSLVFPSLPPLKELKLISKSELDLVTHIVLSGFSLAVFFIWLSSHTCCIQGWDIMSRWNDWSSCQCSSRHFILQQLLVKMQCCHIVNSDLVYISCDKKLLPFNEHKECLKIW